MLGRQLHLRAGRRAPSLREFLQRLLDLGSVLGPAGRRSAGCKNLNLGNEKYSNEANEKKPSCFALVEAEVAADHVGGACRDGSGACATGPAAAAVAGWPAALPRLARPGAGGETG